MTFPFRRWCLALLAVVTGGAFVPVLPSTADAQYFGRNKVQYEDFDFRVLETEHFDIYHYEQERDGSVMAARMAERWYARLSRLLDYELTGRQPFVLYASHPHFRQTTAIPGEIGESTGGVTEPLKRRIVMPMAGPLAETDHVVGHELVHGFQYSMTGVDPKTPLAGAPAISNQPLFVVEGMAEYLSTGSQSVLTARWMRDELIRDDRDFPTVSDLRNSRKFFPYRYGHSLWAYVGGTWGDDAVRRIFLQSVRSSPGAAIRSVLGVPPDSLSAGWRRSLEQAYGPVLERTSDPSEFGEPFITEEKVGGGTNLGPAVSPDGERVVFLSERSRFAFEMYVADVETGEVLRQLTETAVDPHYQSLQFVNSAGAWAPDSERFAFAAVSKGQPLLVVMNARTGDRLRELELDRFGEVFNPTWSPDGERIAFVANDGGTLDLFTVELASGALQRLTNDEYAEIHPAWSPDGGRIAFATDRFGTDLGTLSYGDFRLASVDLSTGEISALPSFEDARNSNPQWGPDGTSLYFLSDHGGIANVYRVEPDAGDAEPVPLTNVNTGVSGITDLSPALSVAQGSGRVVFGAVRHGDFNLYRTDDPTPVPVEDRLDAADRERIAGLPPFERSDQERVDALLANAMLGLPSPVTFRTHDYNPSLGLDYIAQPTLVAGASSSTGVFIGGGAALFFSDMLGQHALTNVLQLSILGGNVVNGVGALAQYENRESRLRWGGIAGQMPQINQSLRQFVADVDGDGGGEVVRQTLRFWQVNRRAVGVLSYPFTSTLRAELTGGFQRIDYDLETKTEIFALNGRRLDEQTQDAPACETPEEFQTTFCEPAALNQGVTSVALVHDASLGGPTGPIMGSRGRLEVSPTFGTLNYFQALGDLRRYVMPFEPLTLAGRILHLGRYGSGADDGRLAQLFIGYPSLVRGYDFRSFDFRQCNPNLPIEDCSEFTTLEQLFGTRMAVGNLEARLPLLGPLGILGQSAAVPPIDLIGFYDAGVAWTAASKASFLDGPRDPVSSAGVGLRVNLLGFAIGEVAWVTPFERPDKDSFVTFSLTPAF